MPQYFLSYARADMDFALKLVDDLSASHIDVWVDQRNIRPSERWDRAIEAALRDSEAVVVILSPRSVASENVLDEIGFALDRKKTVIPVLYETCDVPIRINRLQRIDFTSDYAAAIERCRAVLGARAKRPLDPALIQRAEGELAAILGPLATRLVEVDAIQARDADDLYRLLGSHILNPKKREAFLKNAGRAEPPPSKPPAFSDAMLEAVTTELTKIMGPISPHLVKQAAREAESADDLNERVAAHVSDIKERTQLLKRLRAIGAK